MGNDIAAVSEVVQGFGMIERSTRMRKPCPDCQNQSVVAIIAKDKDGRRFEHALRATRTRMRIPNPASRVANCDWLDDV